MSNKSGCCMVISNNGQVYVSRRHPSCSRYPLLLQFPGGNIEENENPLDAVVREVKEEVDLRAHFFNTTSHKDVSTGVNRMVSLDRIPLTYGNVDIGESYYLYPFVYFYRHLWDTKLRNMEPHKALDCGWVNVAKLSGRPDLMPGVQHIIDVLLKLYPMEKYRK